MRSKVCNGRTGGEDVKPIVDDLREAEQQFSANLHRRESDLRDVKRQLLEKVRRRERVSQNIHDAHREQMTFGERMADNLAQLAGS